MALDSKAYFTARLTKLGLGDEKDLFENLGWTTLGDFANAANYRPTATDEGPFIKDVILPLFGDENHRKKPSVRRLFFEAFSMFAADINRRATWPDEDDKPKKLPLAEKGARWETVKAKLVGLELEGQLEPSDSLVDKLVQMEESGQLRYVRWEEYTRKNQEIRGIKKEEYWKEDPSSGVLERVHRDNED